MYSHSSDQFSGNTERAERVRVYIVLIICKFDNFHTIQLHVKNETICFKAVIKII